VLGLGLLIPIGILLILELINDTIINIQDIIILISSILGSVELTQDQNFSGDSNMDSIIDILDIVSIINVILGNN